MLFSPAISQISGRIVDASNQSPLPGATIVYRNQDISVSDSSGRFYIEVLSYPAELLVRYVGYEPEKLIIDESVSFALIELTASNYMLGEVVVTAYDNRQTILESPASISLISRKDLKLDNDVTIVSALNRIPGIYMHSGTYNTSRLTIRGIGSRTLFGTSKIRAYYEGIPLTSGDGETSVEDIDPNLIERIEIIKGPSSSLYGAGLGGTLLIKAKSPAGQNKSVRYQVTGGSYGYLKNALSLDYGTEKHRLSANVNQIRSDGYRENNEFRRISSGITYKSYLSEKTRLDFIGNYIDLKAYIPSSIDRTTYENNPQAAAPTWKNAEGYEDYKKFLTGVGINHEFDQKSSMSAHLFLSGRDSYEPRPFNILGENTTAAGGRAKYQYSQKWDFVKMEMLAGLEYFIDFYKWKTFEIIDKEEGDLITDNKETRENINFFIKSDFTFPTKTYLTLGLNINRTNYEYRDLYSVDNEDNSGDYQFGVILSPRVGVTQPLNRNMNVYINISHGFSPPALAETLTPEGSINPDIQPETGMNYEIGTKGQVFRNKMFYDIVLFTMDIRNLIVARRTGDDAFVGVNAGKTVHNGMEITVNYDFIKPGVTRKRLYGFITYTLANYSFKEFVDGENDYSGNELTGVPGHVLNAGLAFQTKPGIYGNLNYQFVDEMPMRDDNSAYSDPYQLVNLKAGFKKAVSRYFDLDIHAIVNNLTDSRYASMIMVNASSFGGSEPRYYYPGLPRNYYFGAEIAYRF
ncbi:MAG: TonB-dependent receptor [Cyclobacteriaceae bacterium]|nr:TonB-dependent receptor [Cyclobacteriaceae bacterium]